MKKNLFFIKNFLVSVRNNGPKWFFYFLPDLQREMRSINRRTHPPASLQNGMYARWASSAVKVSLSSSWMLYTWPPTSSGLSLPPVEWGNIDTQKQAPVCWWKNKISVLLIWCLAVHKRNTYNVYITSIYLIMDFDNEIPITKYWWMIWICMIQKLIFIRWKFIH